MSPGGEGIYTSGGSATEKMTVINWNTLVLYPEGYKSDDLTFTASLKIPDGWKFGTSLPDRKPERQQHSVCPHFAHAAGGLSCHHRAVHEGSSTQSGEDASG